mgnify:CR=1 FL=1
MHIGVGPWGQNYLKSYKAFPITVSIATRDSWRAMLDDRPAGVVICTPPQTHIEIAQFALERDIPVMIEKPLAPSLDEGKLLSGYVAPILVDHLYLFTHGYQELKRNVEEKNIHSIETIGMGTKSHEDHSVLWDYAPHDISMILDLMGCVPDVVSVKKVLTSNLIFEMELHFGNIVTNSRFGVGEKRERKVSVKYENGEDSFEDIVGNEVPGPLHNAIGVFLSAIEGKPDQRLGLGLSLEVLRVLEACEKSLVSGAFITFEKTHE